MPLYNLDLDVFGSRVKDELAPPAQHIWFAIRQITVEHGTTDDFLRDIATTLVSSRGAIDCISLRGDGQPGPQNDQTRLLRHQYIYWGRDLSEAVRSVNPIVERLSELVERYKPQSRFDFAIATKHVAHLLNCRETLAARATYP